MRALLGHSFFLICTVQYLTSLPMSSGGMDISEANACGCIAGNTHGAESSAQSDLPIKASV